MTAYHDLIEASELITHLEDKNWVVVDCRFNLADADYGINAYRESHIPRARYAHLDIDLSSPIIPGKTGRHPLPNIEKFCQKLGDWGVEKETQVIAYDDMFGAIAARLWWLLNYVGHPKVAILNGAWQNWLNQNLPTETKLPDIQQKTFKPSLQKNLVVDENYILQNLYSDKQELVDSRDSNRYSGMEEPIDPIAGHIPGAKNFPFKENLSEDGKFLSKELLRKRFEKLQNDSNLQPIFYCGSGVTACHNILAYHYADLGFAKLYPDSWSGWIVNPTHPVACINV